MMFKLKYNIALSPHVGIFVGIVTRVPPRAVVLVQEQLSRADALLTMCRTPILWVVPLRHRQL